MAIFVGMVNGGGSWLNPRLCLKNEKKKVNKMRVFCSSSSISITDQYKTLKNHPGASETDIKEAFKQLSLWYHPDVCKGSKCLAEFQSINEAYNFLMKYLSGEPKMRNLSEPSDRNDVDDDDTKRGMMDRCGQFLKKLMKDFSVLPSEIPWDDDSTWSTMSLYIFSLHIPLSFGGLSVVAQIMHQPVLDPQTEAVSLLLIQTIELFAALAFLRYTMKTEYKLGSFLQGTKFSKERNWVQASVLGFGFLILLVVLTSYLADTLIGPKDVNNPIVKEILSSGPIAKTTCFLLYSFVTPLLEETVYRGFLLTSLTSKMKWQQAVILSSCIFSLAHFSIENSLQLFIIGCVLGCSYCCSCSCSDSSTETYGTVTKKVGSGSGCSQLCRKMLAVFERSIGKPPEELSIPSIRSQNVKTLKKKKKNREEIVEVFLSLRPDSTSYNLSHGNFMALSHEDENPLHPRSIVVMDDVFCIFVGNVENICDLRRHYGLSRHTTDAMLVIEVYKVLRDRAPYPSDQVIRDLVGKFAFILFDAKFSTLFAARDRDGGVQFKWGVAGDGSLVCSDHPEIISEACGKSCAAFPPGCIFMSGHGLVSFVHPMYKVRAIIREDDDDDDEGHNCTVMFQVDLYTRLHSIPRTGSAANWADATAVVEGE
ncbi:DnaJ domain [Macleaya cordata]|uniref:DnaJ domain n=1 Tax=Macleaya cordata TaxID=56857 RepID=A0A200PQT4_MACCD|nr:DnaJ domain [Macleaya cordata]